MKPLHGADQEERAIMTGSSRRWRLAGLVILAGMLTTGCSLPGLLYFVGTGFMEPMEEPGEMKLASKDKKEVKVAIAVYAGMDLSSDLVRVDHDLTSQLVRQLQQSCKENKEKVTLVPAHKIQDYKMNHPDWFLKPKELGRHFDADKLVVLEIRSFSLYEQGSANQLYRGKTDIAVKLFDLRDTDDYPRENFYHCQYPNSRGPVPVDEKNAREFYLELTTFVVKHLSWYFTAHPLSETVTCE
jgi:hypothetical protein